ncbi:unnamed protein product [Linum tenue]|uniref:Uncharacterized protein n=1 Tax=Linum tenue TaxID=586396 RepID=A0AAV0MEK7_9ROSI|nr:unnamed protein product [Linum tenue]
MNTCSCFFLPANKMRKEIVDFRGALAGDSGDNPSSGQRAVESFGFGLLQGKWTLRFGFNPRASTDCSVPVEEQDVKQRVPSIVDRNEESSGTGDPDDDAIEIRSSLSTGYFSRRDSSRQISDSIEVL